jgi:hypothetical protein
MGLGTSPFSRTTNSPSFLRDVEPKAKRKPSGIPFELELEFGFPLDFYRQDAPWALMEDACTHDPFKAIGGARSCYGRDEAKPKPSAANAQDGLGRSSVSNRSNLN